MGLAVFQPACVQVSAIGTELPLLGQPTPTATHSVAAGQDTALRATLTKPPGFGTDSRRQWWPSHHSAANCVGIVAELAPTAMQNVPDAQEMLPSDAGTGAAFATPAVAAPAPIMIASAGSTVRRTAPNVTKQPSSPLDDGLITDS